MKLQDIVEIEKDIICEVIDVGTLDELENIVWKKQIPSSYDKVYSEDTKKAFKDYPVFGLILGRMRKDELDVEGLKYDDAFKLYIVGKSFRDLEFTPKESDRLVFNSITYDVVKIRSIIFGGMDILYVIFAVESELAAQTEEYREEQDPYFEIDASQDSTQTNDTGINDDLFIDVPALVLGDYTQNFDILADENDRIEITYNSETYLIQVEEGYVTAAQLVADLQSKIDANFGSNLLVVFESNSKVGLKTVAIGEGVEFTLNSTDYSIYDTLGLTIGLYSGGRKLKLEDTGDYDENGDPING